MKKVFGRLLVFLLIAAAAAWLLYPVVSNQMARWNDANQMKAYHRAVREKTAEEIEADFEETVYYKTDHIHTFTHGDVNNDGMIDIKDATEIQRYAAQFIELDSTALAAADVSGDGNVTIADATKIQRYIAKLINELVTVST